METSHSSFNLDDRAFQRATVGLMQPIEIWVAQEDIVEDDNTVVNRAHLPRQGMPPPVTEEPPNMDDYSNIQFIMASATDLKAFQELEGYRYHREQPDSDPEDDESESDVSDENDATDDTSDVTGEGLMMQMITPHMN